MAFEFEILLLGFFEPNFMYKTSNVRGKMAQTDKEMDKQMQNMNKEQ
jgi:hypothetical protein